MQSGLFRRSFPRILLTVALVAAFLCLPGAGPLSSTPADAVLSAESGDAELNAAGFTAYREKRYAEAVRLFRLAIARNPSEKIYYNNEAAALMNEGRYDEAYEALSRAIALDPRFCKALSNMAITCFYLNRFSEAYEYYRRAKDADGAYAGERFERGRVTEKLRELRQRHPGNMDVDGIYERLKRGIDAEVPGL